MSEVQMSSPQTQSLKAGEITVARAKAIAKMSSPIAMATPITKIATFHPSSIASSVQSLQALVALRESFPGARIHSFARAPIVPLLRNFAAVDEVVQRPGGDVSGQATLMAKLHGADFDIAISFSQSSNALLLTWSTGANVRAGFVPSRLESFLTHKVEKQGPFTETASLELVRAVGAYPRGSKARDMLEFSPETYTKIEKWMQAAGMEGRYYVVAPALPRRTPRPKIAPPIVTAKHMQSPVDSWNHALLGITHRWPVVLIAPQKWEFTPTSDAKSFINASAKLDSLGLAALIARSEGVIGDESGALALARLFDKKLALGDSHSIDEISRHTFGL
jgi:ADP-heptose:LPS heptosyltransferase